MFEFISLLFDGTDFPARWDCGNWSAGHGYLHIVSDALIFGAYMAIPLVIVYFIRKRPDIPFPRIFWLFCAFIVACGLTHLNEVIIFWHPMYRFAGVVKLATAAVSWATVAALLPTLPQALALRTPAQLESEVEARTRELLAAEERFRRVVEASPTAKIMVAAQRRITLINERTVRLFGYEHDDLLGQRVDRLVPPDVENHAQLVEGFFAKPKARPMGAERELHAVTKSGERVPVEIALTPVDMPEGPCVLASVVDITQRREVEKEREALIVELTRSNDELQQFAYIASHDLQEPLRSVVSFTQLLAERYGDQLDDRAKKYMHYIVEGGQRMQQLIGDLLTYSRVGTHGGDFEPASVQQAIETTVRNLTAMLAESGGSVDWDDDLPDVAADSAQLVQLLQNLVGNALKFRRDGVPPRVFVSASPAALPSMVELRVCDNGIGIDSEFHDQIFRPFQRLHARGEYDGSGIGLAIAKKIVERHQGEIWIEERRDGGQGVEFCFTLPVHHS